MPSQLLYITTYNIHADLVRNSIKKAWHVLQREHGKLFVEKPKFVYRIGKCLANTLVKSDIEIQKKSLLSTANKKAHSLGVC